MESLQSNWECDDDVLPDFDDANDQLHPASAPSDLVQPPPPGPLKDNEISPSLHPGWSFYFRANDLDAAVQSAKKMKKVKKTIKIRGKKRTKSDRKKLRGLDPKVFVARTSRFLKEPKRYLIEAAVVRLGIEVVHELVLEVKTIEENGGHMILDNKRTPILWNVIRSRNEEDYKAIMAAGRIYEKQRKQRKKQRRMMEKTDMVVDGQPSKKRRRRGGSGLGMALPEAQVKGTGVTLCLSRLTPMEDIQLKVDPENSCALMQVQSAWAEGVEKEKHTSHSNDVEMFDVTVKSRPSSIAEHLRIP